MQDYRQVAGRVTAVAIDPADPTGNTVYIGAAQGGVWKSTNAAFGTANNVAWTPLTDNQATLSIGAIAIQEQQIPDATKSVILAATGEANNSADSYFGLGILRSTDAGSTWTLVSTANNGALSFSGLGGTRMAFKGQSNVAVAAMAASSEGLIDGALIANTKRGLYTSVNAGQSWIYDALVDPGGATDATSATSVVYNSTAGLFYAAVRYHSSTRHRTALPGRGSLISPAEPCSAPRRARRSRLPTIGAARYIGARSALCLDAMRCMSGMCS